MAPGTSYRTKHKSEVQIKREAKEKGEAVLRLKKTIEQQFLKSGSECNKISEELLDTKINQTRTNSPDKKKL